MEAGRRSFRILKDKPIGKRLLGRPKRRWKNNIRIGLEIDVNMSNRVDSSQLKVYWRVLVNVALKLRIP